MGRPQSSLHERTERSLPDLLLERIRAGPDEVAFREKHLGVYKGYTWSQFGAEVEQVTLGLKELGVKSGDRVVVMGDACIEWVVADYAIMAAGAVTVGIYATCAPSEVAFILSDCGANIVILETQEHLDKLLPVLDQLTDVSRFVVIDTRALFMFEHPMYMTFDELRELGSRRIRRNPGEFEETGQIGHVRPVEANLPVDVIGRKFLADNVVPSTGVFFFAPFRKSHRREPGRRNPLPIMPRIVEQA